MRVWGARVRARAQQAQPFGLPSYRAGKASLNSCVFMRSRVGCSGCCVFIAVPLVVAHEFKILINLKNIVTKIIIIDSLIF